jgi:hypothetical protein
MAKPLSSELRGISNRGIEGDIVTDEDRAIPNTASDAGANEPKLEARDQEIVDEAFFRGASVGDAMGVLFLRALSRTSEGIPASHAVAGGTSRRDGITSGGRTAWRRFSLEDLVSLEGRELSDTQQRRLDEVENLRTLVVARHDAYVALAKREFDNLPQAVQRQFQPQPSGRYADSYRTAEEKYRGMRGAYYRAGWTDISRDVLSLIEPTTLFGVNVGGGTHRELKDLLALVETEFLKSNPGGNQRGAAGFEIGGFMPRFQGESDQLSNHAFGLAIDIDPSWNPQLKKPAAIKAFERATGEKMNVLLRNFSSLDDIRATYERVVQASRKLQAWLAKFLPLYEQLEEDRAKYLKDPSKKGQVTVIDNELIANPDLAALKTLIQEYSKVKVQGWQAYGIVTIPVKIIELFVSLGRKNRPRWGGEYERTKDVMHLELLELASPESLGRSHGPGRRLPRNGLDDLIRGA